MLSVEKCKKNLSGKRRDYHANCNKYLCKVNCFGNAAGHTTVAGGTVHPRGTVLLSSNKSFVVTFVLLLLYMPSMGFM